jgi:hypothetical protein
MRLAALTAAEKQRWLNFCTGDDESWIMRVNPPSGLCMAIDQELPRQVPQTIGATKSMLMVFFNPKEFAIVDLLPQNRSFTAVYFVSNVILPLANRYAHQLGISALACCICISTIPSATPLGMSMNS